MRNDDKRQELVEKMRNSLGRKASHLSKQCAQIAVDFAEEEKKELIEINEIDCLFLEKWIKILEPKNWHEGIIQEMKDMLNEKQLLKKHV